MNSWPEGIHQILPNRTRVIIIYPTVQPHLVVIPIVSCIVVLPIIVFLMICWLRKMAVKRRQRARLTQREDPWNERSCASIVQRSPPLSLSIGNGCGNRFGSVDIELAPTTLAHVVTASETNYAPRIEIGGVTLENPSPAPHYDSEEQNHEEIPPLKEIHNPT